jgi:hypothetical protein
VGNTEPESRRCADRLEELVWLFSRTERRREYICKPLMVAQSSEEFERLTPQKLQEVS